MENLKNHLKDKIKTLNGSWISKNSGYEEKACEQLGFKCLKSRYWDCYYDGLYIEIKKGKSIWLDEIRYCEIFMNKCEHETITIFLIPSKTKDKIENIIVLDTRKIINFLIINEEMANYLFSRLKIIKRSLNSLQSMTLNDAKTIADYIVKNDD